MSFYLVQAVIIGAVVGASALVALDHFFPNWTSRYLGRLADRLLAPQRNALSRWLGQQLHAKLSRAGGCGTSSGCGSCKGCAPASNTPMEDRAQVITITPLTPKKPPQHG
jgi:hypothetical protein